MGYIVTVHSYRGGTGKSNVTANLAAALALEGCRVAAVDTDIQSPGINILFGYQTADLKSTLNDYLAGSSSIEGCAYDVGKRVDLQGPGKLYLLPASLKYLEIAKVLKNGFDLERMADGFRQALDTLRLDYLLVDTHPGLNEETMLYTVMSRLLIVLLRPDQQDYTGTAVVIEVARKLGVPKIGLLLNKVLPAIDTAENRQHLSAQYGCPVLGALPFDQAVMENASASLMVLSHAQHPWSASIRQLASRVVSQTA